MNRELRKFKKITILVLGWIILFPAFNNCSGSLSTGVGPGDSASGASGTLLAKLVTLSPADSTPSLGSGTHPARCVVGDFDKDGVEDVAATGQLNSTSGAIRIFSGATGVKLIDVSSNFAQINSSSWTYKCRGGGFDFNGDGTADFILDFGYEEVGAGTTTSKTNRYWISGADQTAHVIQENVNTSKERTVARVDDVNHDGIPDFQIADYFTSGLQSYYRVRLFSGADASEITAAGTGFPQSVKFDNQYSYQYAFLRMGDVNRDGIRDWLLTVPSSAGSSKIYDGSSLRSGQFVEVRDTLNSKNTALANFDMTTVVDVGDVNSDGVDDYAVGGRPMTIRSGADDSILVSSPRSLADNYSDAIESPVRVISAAGEALRLLSIEGAGRGAAAGYIPSRLYVSSSTLESHGETSLSYVQAGTIYNYNADLLTVLAPGVFHASAFNAAGQSSSLLIDVR